MDPGAARVWDLVGPDDARRFLHVGLPAASGGQPAPPLPCRAARLPQPAASGLAALDRARPAGVAVFDVDEALVVCGPAAALTELARRWDAPEATLLARLLDRYAHPERLVRFADGASWDLSARTHLMGVVNVTPDSFSDGGRFVEPEAAVDQALRLADEGADIVDIGGESTRPGAAAVPAAAEAERVLPVIETLRRQAPRLRISVDTRRASVAREALARGADLVNDVSGLADPEMAPLLAATGAPVVIMHMRGTPDRMQADTRYGDLVGEVLAFLAQGVHAARAAGVRDGKVLVDPGIGFGKSAAGNEQLLRELGSFRSLGLPILVGISRKSFVGKRTRVSEPAARLAGSLAGAVAAALAGAAVVRVHDVKATREALAVSDALRRPLA
jgi:dihydropteroate synthase